MARSVPRAEFTREMKKTHVILMPNMLPIHFGLAKAAFGRYGYRLEVLTNEGPGVIDAGLKYVHNDTCYPALLCIGQMIDALQSGRYDIDRTALMILQTGGGCRASNYIFLLRKALVQANLARVPVISLNLSGFEKHAGFHLSPPLIADLFLLLLYGDMLMLLHNQVKPYEKNPGEADRLTSAWTDALSGQLARAGGMPYRAVKRNLSRMAEDFGDIPIEPRARERVGIVGEVYVKYFPLANNYLAQYLTEQGCEVMIPGIVNFITFKADNRVEDIKLYGGNIIKKAALRLVLIIVTRAQQKIIDALHNTRFSAPPAYAQLKEMIRGVLGYGNKMGEGWMLPAEIIELIHAGYKNVVCAQPFGCLPNHVVGRGMIRKLREMFPEANITPIDYDPGATRVNQINRIKLMLAVSSGQRRADYASPSGD